MARRRCSGCAIIEAIEETGNVLFALTADLASRIEHDEHITLRYLGHFHFDLETGHAMNAQIIANLRQSSSMSRSARGPSRR